MNKTLRYLLLALSLGLPVIFLFLNSEVAGYADTHKNLLSQSKIGKEERLLFGNSEGSAGLKDLLDASRPTQNKNVREVVIPTSQITEEREKKKYFAEKVINEFFNIVDENSIDLNPESAAALDIAKNGIEVKLAHTGKLRLKITDNLEKTGKPPTATFMINEVNVPGYEDVKQVDFIIE